MNSPFSVLGLVASAELTDDDVRVAWRRVAAATHPDRADGGDPAAFAAAAAAYTLLRTQAGRGEALADVRARSRRPATSGPVPGLIRRLPRQAAGLASQIARGRPLRLALRMLAVTAAGTLAVAAAGWQPASAAVITGALTWLLRTGRADLARPTRPGSSSGRS
jgi:curved DNA-binding protein CbpA